MATGEDVAVGGEEGTGGGGWKGGEAAVDNWVVVRAEDRRD
jgi:hypothetical protein